MFACCPAEQGRRRIIRATGFTGMIVYDILGGTTSPCYGHFTGRRVFRSERRH